MARPSKRTPEAVASVVKLLKLGNTRKTACVASGISEDTFARWLKSSADFAENVKKAEEEAVARNVAIIQQAARTTWQAAAWWLERRRPEDFGQTQKIYAKVETLSDDELVKAAKDILGGIAGAVPEPAER